MAQVEIQSQSIRGLALNENYADALREIDRLLMGDLLKQLPETLRDRRTAELTTQQQQLLKRTLPSEDPVQAQAVSLDGTLLAMGDAAGRISVFKNPSEAMLWPDEPVHKLRLDKSISQLKFVDEESLLVASGSDLLLWRLGRPCQKNWTDMQQISAALMCRTDSRSVVTNRATVRLGSFAEDGGRRTEGEHAHSCRLSDSRNS